MADDIVVSLGTGYPQNANNPTHCDTLESLAGWVGAREDPDLQNVALEVWNDAVREFNRAAWKCNRLEQDITLLAGTGRYQLISGFRSPESAFLVDSNGDEVDRLQYLEYRIFQYRFQNRTSGQSMPEWYTLQNVHRDGFVEVFPEIASAGPTYPTLRVTYFGRIVETAACADQINVPEELYGAINALAVAKMIAKKRSFEEARDAFIYARMLWNSVEGEHRAWPDF